jgi:hypothetical protein
MENTIGGALRGIYNSTEQGEDVVDVANETPTTELEGDNNTPPNVVVPDAVNTQNDAPSVNDESVLKYISEKTGKQASSFEDLFKVERVEVEKESFVSDEIKAINDFVKTTGKSVNDFYELQKITSTTMTDEEKVKLKMRYDNPQLSEREVEILFKRQFKKFELSDNMDDSEKEAAMEENSFADILLKKEARTASEFINTLAEKIKTPASAKEEPYDSNKYKELWQEASQEVSALSFGLTKDKDFTWNVDAEERKFFETPVTPDAFVKEYINTDGSWNMAKWAKDVYMLKSMPKIIRSAAALRSGEGVEELIDTVKQVQATQTAEPTASGARTLSLAKAMFSRT